MATIMTTTQTYFYSIFVHITCRGNAKRILGGVDQFLCPQRNFGRQIVIALSVQPSVSPSVRQSVPLRVRSISPIFFEVGIPNLVCGCILG